MANHPSQRTPDRNTGGNVARQRLATHHNDSDVGIDVLAATRRVAVYLAQIGWSEEAAIQRARHLVDTARETLEATESNQSLYQRQLVRSALELAIDSAIATTAAHAVPSIRRKPMAGGGMARRVNWMRWDWWTGRTRSHKN